MRLIEKRNRIEKINRSASRQVGLDPDLEVGRRQLVEIAQELYMDGDNVEVERTAVVSECDAGYWVQAWVFVPRVQAEEESE